MDDVIILFRGCKRKIDAEDGFLGIFFAKGFFRDHFYPYFGRIQDPVNVKAPDFMQLTPIYDSCCSKFKLDWEELIDNRNFEA